MLSSTVNYGTVVSGSAARPSGVNANYIYARWTGYIVPSVTGKYTLGVNASNGANLFLGNTALVTCLAITQTANSSAAYTQSASIQLTAGVYYPVTLEWQYGAGSAYEIQLLWTPPAGTVAVIPSANLSTAQTSVTGNLSGSWWNGTSGLWYPSGAGLIDFANPSIPNKTAANVTYSGGVTVASLQPAQVGADVTSTNTSLNTSNVGNQTAAAVAGAATAVILQNPNFAAGNTGWGLGSYWSIASGTPSVPGSAYLGKWFSATSATSAITNAQNIPCSPGQILTASCQIEGATSSTASGVSVRINFYTAAGTVISSTYGNSINTAGSWQLSRAVGTAPANTAYVQIDCAVFSGVGTWYICGFSAAFQASSLSEIPAGGGCYPAVELGADKTLNHVVISSIFYGLPTGYTAADLYATPVSWSVTSNGVSDVFDIEAVFLFHNTSGTPNIFVFGLVDGVVSSSFGFGCSNDGTALQFTGDVTGLSAGTHTIELYFGVQYVGAGGVWSTSPQTFLTVVSAYGQIQQISS